ncbi:MAG: hypothetical protein ACK50O_06915 [Pirellulaceae bacterium]
MVDFLPCLREGEIDPYACIRSRCPQDFIPPNVIGRSDTDGESNRRGGIDRKSLVSMLARLAQRTASVWDGSVEYEYEYRDAEYEYEYRDAEYEYEYRDAEYEYEYRDAEYEYDEITEWMNWELRASARALESDMVRKTRDCRQ